MKVLLANKFFFLNGGSETVFFQEREYLRNQGHGVIDFSMKDPRNIASAYGSYFVKNFDFKKSSSFKTALSFIHSVEAVSKISKLVEETRPDIAHLHNIYHQLTPSIIPALKSRGVKVILTLHDTKLVCPNYLSLCHESICDECKGKYYYKTILKDCQRSIMKSALLAIEAYFHRLMKSYEGVDCFIAPSYFLAEKIEAVRPELGQVRVLYNGIDTEAILPSEIDNGYILYLGRLSKEKGVPTLLKAYQKLKIKPQLKIVGTGPLLESLRENYSDVVFTGYKSGDELTRLIARSSCVVVPSEWYENCSMVVLEAMAYGKPVVGSKVGGIPEQVEDGVSGALFTMGDADELVLKLTMLMGDVELRRRLGRAARAKVEDKYSLAAHNQGLMDIYSKVLHS
ncbi:glycosyltransferase family 4 protein [Desulfovibrio mangrovi]|uniref:glycosyltransferase family 4 protein n=1 Tax=Desulfovibrio mangrovi TaxID=2976983 RepID=UPI00224805F5|nr:glycosyltransferase family 4 protein [Desulfovibrio mangrovi]UZP67617.1 glycosyltransferase family 4 protein [Desulfovibrio mangrovi]